MITLKHNSVTHYKIEIKADSIVLRYKSYIRYNLINFLKIEDTIDINDEVSFCSAKKLMLEIISEYNKLLN